MPRAAADVSRALFASLRRGRMIKGASGRVIVRFVCFHAADDSFALGSDQFAAVYGRLCTDAQSNATIPATGPMVTDQIRDFTHTIMTNAPRDARFSNDSSSPVSSLQRAPPNMVLLLVFDLA